MEYLNDDEKEWCKMRDENAVEDSRHYICVCPNANFTEVKKAGHAKIKARVIDMSLRIQEAFMNTLVMVNGCLVIGVGESVDERLKG